VFACPIAFVWRFAAHDGVVPNGIEFENFNPLEVRETFDWRESHANMKEDYLLWLGRFCEEKGAHLAIQAARRAGMRLVLAGTIYPFSYHQQYFQREILPHLDIRSRIHSIPAFLVESPKQKQKLRLLHNARAVLIPSLAEETSSLVAMEAAACGTQWLRFVAAGFPRSSSRVYRLSGEFNRGDGGDTWPNR